MISRVLALDLAGVDAGLDPDDGKVFFARGLGGERARAGNHEHAQLAAYQIAVQQGLVPGATPGSLGGARLVIVSKTLAKSEYRIAHQHALDGEARRRFLQRVAEVARGMSAAGFTAQVESHCADTQRRVHPCRIHTVPAVSS